jgi:hypothetical protein
VLSCLVVLDVIWLFMDDVVSMVGKCAMCVGVWTIYGLFYLLINYIFRDKCPRVAYNRLYKVISADMICDVRDPMYRDLALNRAGLQIWELGITDGSKNDHYIYLPGMVSYLYGEFETREQLLTNGFVRLRNYRVRNVKASLCGALMRGSLVAAALIMRPAKVNMGF